MSVFILTENSPFRNLQPIGFFLLLHCSGCRNVYYKFDHDYTLIGEISFFGPKVEDIMCKFAQLTFE